jgi:5-methylcytosine-specific restriction protein A
MPSRPKTFRPSHLSTPAQTQRAYNRFARDKTLSAIYWTQRWKDYRARIRRERILCERCKAQTPPRYTPGQLVHHKIDPRDDPDKTFDDDNVVLVCRRCHNEIHGAQRTDPK